MTADVARAARAAGLAGRATDVRDVEVRGTDVRGAGTDVTGTVVRGAGTDVTGTVVRGADAGQRPDARRMLQLALAGLWLLDALLQFQAFMFGPGFAQMLRAAAAGSPAFVTGPANWAAGIVAAHPATANCAFAAIQLLIGLGIAWRPALRVALAASIAWSVAVWWLGEGLGGLLNGSASPANGAPGPVILYALLAVLLWPGSPARESAFPAGRFTGMAAARGCWLAAWGGLAALALLPATRAPGALSRLVAAAAAGQPHGLATAAGHLSGYLRQHGPAVAFVLAAVLAIVALGIFLPRPGVRAILVLALLVAALLWLAQGLGGILTGSGTDPGSGPLLALLVVAYWPPCGARRPGRGVAP
jgi:hypothetical protein